MSEAANEYVVATDVGGTCTDTVVFAVGEPIQLGKALSTPPNFADGVMASIASAAHAMDLSTTDLLAATRLFIHGTTVIDNAILTRQGPRTGLITTEGFEDTLLATRGPYGRWAGLSEEGIKHPIATDRAEPLVDYSLIRGVPERIDYKGAVIRPLDEEEAERAVRYLVNDKGVEAIAICFLWSFKNADHERRVAEIVQRVAHDTFVTVSSAVAPIPGEYERTSTTVINAFGGRIAHGYLTDMKRLLAGCGYDGPLLVMQGYGGLLPAEEAVNRSVGMIECGPAAGVLGSKYLGQLMGDLDVIATDMGGTTFKAAVIEDGQLEYARNPILGRFHYIAPKIEVVSIGAGGGSIVSLDPRTGAPRIGPRSAGADPGPICYGRSGTEPTLTDVLLLIGYLDPDIFLGGTMTLDVDTTRDIFTRTIAEPMGMEPDAAAIGIYRIAVAQSTDLVREVTIERGVDPREFVLHAFGGTCPLVCALFGEELGVKRIVVPYAAAVNCAFGLVSADIVHEYTDAVRLRPPFDPDELTGIFARMETRATEQLQLEGIDERRMRLERSVDLRFARQVHEVTTPVRDSGPLDDSAIERLIGHFESLYERKFGKGSSYRGAGVEMTLIRLTARGFITPPAIEKVPQGTLDASAAKTGTRDVFVDASDGFAPADIYDFTRLAPGNVLTGPAVIHTPITTIVVQQDQTGHVDEYRNLIIEFA